LPILEGLVDGLRFPFRGWALVDVVQLVGFAYDQGLAIAVVM